MAQNIASAELAIHYSSVTGLRENPRNARTHSKRQIRQIADSIRAFGFLNPVLVDDTGMVLAGHGRLKAAHLLGIPTVPTIRAAGLTEAQKRAYVLADNKLAENAGWDRELLVAELGDLAVLLPSIELDLTVTGFDPPEIDGLFADRGLTKADPADHVESTRDPVCIRARDLWCLGPHRLLCGDARSTADIDHLMAGERVHVTFTDPPYNVAITGHVRGRGRVKHREFAFASGEMTEAEFEMFLRQCLGNVARVSRDGAIAFVCMDWRHMLELQRAGAAVFSELKNLVVWNKTSPGQGSFYRSQHELIFVFKVGEADHRNTFGLGAHGRTRSNVWTYPGLNSFRAGRSDELSMHPTVKPVALVADALRDCSIKGDLVLDVFLGSGTTLLAAEKIGRICYGLEYRPRLRRGLPAAVGEVHQARGDTGRRRCHLRRSPREATAIRSPGPVEPSIRAGWGRPTRLHVGRRGRAAHISSRRRRPTHSETAGMTAEMPRRKPHSSDEYSVGYRRPPTETRFKPGQSGNPKGRPKQPRDAASIMEDALNVRVAITENGRRRYVSMWEVIARRLVNSAAQGDPRATRLLLDFMRRHGANGSEPRPEPTVMAEEDDLIIADFLARHGTAPSSAAEPRADAIADEGAARSEDGKARKT